MKSSALSSPSESSNLGLQNQKAREYYATDNFKGAANPLKTEEYWITVSNDSTIQICFNLKNRWVLLTLPVESKQHVELISLIRTAEWGLLLAGAHSGDRLAFRQDCSRHTTVVPQNGAWNAKAKVYCVPGNSRAAKRNVVTLFHMFRRSTKHSDSKITAKTYWKASSDEIDSTYGWWELCLRFWLPACARTGELLRDCLHELVQRRPLIYKQVRQQKDGGGHYDHQHLPHPHLTTPSLLGAHRSLKINPSHHNFQNNQLYTTFHTPLAKSPLLPFLTSTSSKSYLQIHLHLPHLNLHLH